MKDFVDSIYGMCTFIALFLAIGFWIGLNVGLHAAKPTLPTSRSDTIPWPTSTCHPRSLAE